MKKGKARRHTEETKAKLRAALEGRKFSVETKTAMRVNSSVRIAIKVIDLESGISKEYLSIRQAASELGLDPRGMAVNLKSSTNKPYLGRYALSSTVMVSS